MLALIIFLALCVGTSYGSLPACSLDDVCDSCNIFAAVNTKCVNGTILQQPFYFCNPRTKKIDVDTSSFLLCSSDGVWKQKECPTDARHFSRTSNSCTDPARMTFYAQGTSGSGRVGDVCSFNTDCLQGMYCALGSCRCLSTYIAVDAYCYEKISPSESGCFYDVQCASVWPDSFCKSGMCHCPNTDMKAVKTRDGTMCVWSSGSEPSCPLPSLPPPDSPSALVVLPASGAKTSVTIASCNPHSSDVPTNDEELLNNAFEYKCAVRSQNLKSTEESLPIDVSDMYDCIDNSEFWKSQGVQTDAHPVGACCMNRATTCMQPRRGESDGLGSVPRWWFNAVVGNCQQFLFDPTSAEVSPNNFETLDHCESFCKDTCPRGYPAYMNSKSHLGQIPQSGCTTSNPCGDPYTCTDVASQSLCCPSRKHICSDMGGRQKDPYRSTPYDAGLRFDQITGESADFAFGISTRYYYNAQDGQCHPFTFNGFLGNFNNFANQADCQMFCARLQCPHGNPLSSGTGAPQRCGRDLDCPSTHTCSTEHSVCCPTPQTLCTEPLRVGDCKQSIRSFWYNAETRQCESYLYTGCQGNNNRFGSLNECQSFCKNINAEPKCPQGRAYMDYSGKFFQCGDSPGTGNSCPANYECYFDGLVHGCCPSKAYTCSLQVNKGVACGSGSSYRYYYNNQLKECQSFLFSGCDGNSNNFPNAEKCQNYCEIAICPNGGSPLRANSKIRQCSPGDPCPNGYECTMVETNGISQKRCCPTKAAICSKPPQLGMQPKCNTGGGVTRYYFNMALQTCSSYSSNGCDTSINSFATSAECEDFCLSAGCSNGDTVYKDPNSNRPFVCNTALQNNCPASYTCTLNSLTNEHNCCGSDNMGVCPEGEKAFIDARSSEPRQCAMVADTKCPSGYLCRFSQSRNRYYCCGSISGALCPAGRALFRYQSTQAPIHCSITQFGSGCPPNYSCVSDVPGAFQGYCCSQQPICPGGSAFHLDEKSLMPTSCTRDAFAFCPTGYTCQQQPDTNNHYCCQGQEEGGVQDGCPPTQYAYILDGTAATCDPFNKDDRTCPRDYSCQWSTSNQKYQCCGTVPIKNKPPAIDDGCQSRHFALIDSRTNAPRLCTAGELNACPAGFSCQFSAKKNQFQCCGQSAGCPAKRAAFIAIDGNAQECIPGPDTCQTGYECVKGSYGKNICCSKEQLSECAANERLLNGECVVSMRPGESCTKSEQCSGGSSCIERTCTCPPDQDIAGFQCVKRDCMENQVRIGGICTDRADIGQSCKNSLQCGGNSKCLKGVCDCGPGEIVENGHCVKKPKEIPTAGTPKGGSVTPASTKIDFESELNEMKGIEPKLKNVCPVAGQSSYYEKGTTRLRYCSPSLSDCPKSYSCQYSSVEKQNVCCGDVAVEKPNPKNPHAGICPIEMSPYLLNGKAKTCSAGSCPYGYLCKFSQIKHEYYCCSKVNHKKNTFRRKSNDGCERGVALMYPNTLEPVSCEPARKKCPNGYQCLPNLHTRSYQCCSVSNTRDNAMTFEEVEIQCPSYMKKVEREINGVIKTVCQKD